MGRARGEVHEERLIRHERFLLPNPVYGLLGHVWHQVVALFGRLLHLNWRGALIQRWVPLVSLAANEPVEIFKSSSASWPSIKRPGRTGLPYRYFVALAELRRCVAVELQGAGQGRTIVRQDRAIAGRP